VRRGATIGANATIVCGTTLGEYAFVGAGAVVADDVADYALVVGVPARRVGWMCQCGERLPDSGDGTCAACGSTYVATADGIRRTGGPR
jgi:UDP-2-acetamido-3-amino-2,3-dideoxy-glucuronate N-acetyltransferase